MKNERQTTITVPNEEHARQLVARFLAKGITTIGPIKTPDGRFMLYADTDQDTTDEALFGPCERGPVESTGARP